MKGCRSLTEAEVSQVSASFTGRWALRNKALFVLGLTSGYRISELLSLRVGDVWQQGRVVDWLIVRKRAMKGHPEGRRVRLNPKAQQALQDWLTVWGQRLTLHPSLYLFPSRKGTNQPLRPWQATHLLHQAFTACGLQGPVGLLGTHVMRKTYAKNMYHQLDRDLVELQKALGDARLETTARYLEDDDERIAKAQLAL